MKTHIEFMTAAEALDGATSALFIGRRDRLLADDVTDLLPAGVAPLWPAMIDGCKPGDKGAAQGTFAAGPLARVVAGVISDRCSRHNAPGRPDAVQELVARNAPGEGAVAVILAVDEAAQALGAAAAVARALPEFDRKSARPRPEREVRVAVLAADGKPVALKRLQIVADGVRFAGRLVDMPPNELHTDAFVEIARDVAARVDADITILQGDQVAQSGLGGLWGVGQAATHPPALVILSHKGSAGGRAISLIGKGIVYDTGGLSIKGKDHMPGMKGDMGGAAAVLAAFMAAAELGTAHRLNAVLCLAENSVGPESTRPDDILHLYSGKTVEVNNTDAEGRLVLADGVAWAERHLKPEVIIDLATLTGAQLMATGRRHCASVCNDDALEAAAVAAGRLTGDLVHPLPYVPEFFRGEFKSEVADLKNSVKDRMNAQSSCAGQFIAEHLSEDYAGGWLHLDIAGPSTAGERGTGFGVALLTELLDRL
ncbi:MAG: leucyl aminopeptidase family protein [Myxococcales bacterium]|nr:leucyl aminopeptidase family protein [Myxococcales bacterium]